MVDRKPDTMGPTGAVEVFSWWTGGGEAAGLEAMIEVFAKNTPISNSSMRPWPVAPAPTPALC
jgi:hypothetical protein